MKSGAQAVLGALDAWLSSDPAAVLVGEGVGRSAGNAGSTQGLLGRHGPGRVIDTPIGDRSALGLALGLALGGRSVCVELTGSRGLLAAAEILADAGRLAATDFAPALTVRVPIGGEAGSRVDLPVGDVLRSLDGVRVVCATAATAGSLLAGVLGRGVTVVLEPRAELDRRADARAVDPARLAVLHAGDHATIAAAGEGVWAALLAADALLREGIRVEVVDLVCLSPIDPELHRLVARTGRLIVAHPGDGGLARPALAAAFGDAFLHLESPPGDCPPDPSAVAEAVRRSVHF